MRCKAETEAGEPETTLPAQAGRAAQTKNPSPLSLLVAASGCTDSGCMCHGSPAPAKIVLLSRPMPSTWLVLLSSKDMSFLPGVCFPQVPGKQRSCPTARRGKGQAACQQYPLWPPPASHRVKLEAELRGSRSAPFMHWRDLHNPAPGDRPLLSVPSKQLLIDVFL